MFRRDSKDTQEQIQALRDSAVPPYNPSVPHVPTDVPVTLSSLSTSTDRRHVRSFDNASASGAFTTDNPEEPVPECVDDPDDSNRPAETEVHKYESLCRECTPLCELRIPRPTFDWGNATPSAQVFRFTVNEQIAFQGRLVRQTRRRHAQSHQRS
jgi:hypothetical protein